MLRSASALTKISKPNVTTLDKLIKHFERFPGIGSRQARRFAFHLLGESEGSTAELAELIKNIKAEIIQCPSCLRYFARNGGGSVCRICDNSGRDHSKLMVVASDADITAIERSGIYDGLYFVLGGTVPLLDSEDTKKLNGSALKHIVDERITSDALAEVILGFPVNPDGENTGRYVEKLLEASVATGLKISLLGRGLSTGSELEYADPETIKHALENRH